ncbi:aspartyl protease family protein [Pedobacter montanisoli]|uniref:Aspartyl protease family protein n=1 Tax=Pedobacter montanisoli TaxID=2923277 RepID=A0ABS9ZT39_9SPHI|nr:aspartyl protease family protein [Pedobacter montanisoli]MCJ0741751.1 aspartyl protease family protein [Pedobacter montanisoli]
MITSVFKKAQAQYFQFPEHRKRQTLSFELVKNIAIIKLYINDKGPFNFILDTGVDPMVVTDPSLKESLKVNNTRKIMITGYDNTNTVEAYVTHELPVKIGDAEALNSPVVFLKEDVFNLSGYLGKKISGLIGYNFFSSFVIKINYINRTFTFYSPKKRVNPKGDKIPFEFINHKPHITAQIRFNQSTYPVKLIVDCGASHSLSLETFNNQSFAVPSPNIDANLGVGLTGVISGKKARIDWLKIGRFDFNNVISSFPELIPDSVKKIARNGNLGAEVLNRFNVTFDYANQAMYLKKNSRYTDPFEDDMMGIEIYMEEGPPSRYLITRVDEGSVAQKAGILPNDEIIALNFKPIDSYTIDEIANLFKARDGNAILMECWRKDQRIIKLIRLKKRI